jgi:uroporphyrinogen decarboxylase
VDNPAADLLAPRISYTIERQTKSTRKDVLMDWNEVPLAKDPPNFDDVLAVLQCKQPNRPTLFEFFLNETIFRRVLPREPDPAPTPEAAVRRVMAAYHRLGYDYTALLIPGFSFAEGQIFRTQGRTISLNEGGVIHDRASFDAFPWPDPAAAEYSILERLAGSLPAGMKLIPYTPNGLLENATDLVGYEDLCVLIKDDPQLAGDLFDRIGALLAAYYERAARSDSVGACLVNDDWGFKTQTMFSPGDMRRFVFPWTKRFVEIIHAAGKPAILHSCGKFDQIVEDIIHDMRFDGRHSYEDTILPVEQAYDRLGGRIAILGGIDVDFICRSTPEEVYARSRAMLERSAAQGGYALGSGNSIPDYVPHAGYFAMIRAALDLR